MLNNTKTKAFALAATAALTSGAMIAVAPATAHDHAPAKAAKAAPNIVETAMSTGVHNTLVAAVKAADLVDTLSSPGPFTVFAPTDDAFSKLPDGLVAAALMPENKALLQNVLTYHVVPGNVSAADLVALIDRHSGPVMIDTVAGEKLTVSKFGDTLAITDATGRTTVVSQADVSTSNGTVHVVDGVFLPG